jgi:hypothetical protein
MMRCPRWALLMLMAPALFMAGCGYHMSGIGENDASFNGKTLYRDDVKTVSVPIFTNRTKYTGVEMPLSKAVINQLESQSPYKIAPQGRADSILEGEITGVRIATSSNNRVSAVPQEQIYSLIVKFTWRDLRSGQIYTQRTSFEQTAPYYPTLGEDRWVGEQQNIERLALAIVQELQADWGTGKK